MKGYLGYSALFNRLPSGDVNPVGQINGTSMKKRDISGCSPYDRHVADDMMCTRDGSLTQTIVATVPVSTVSETEALNGLYSRWMRTLDGISLKPHMALWVHLERRSGFNPIGAAKESEFESLDLEADGPPLENHLYVSPVCRVTDGRSQRTWDRDLRLLSRVEPVQTSSVAELRALSAQVRSCLQRYHPAGLGLSGDDDGSSRSSELLAFYARLISGAEHASPGRGTGAGQYLDTSALHFGSDIVAIDSLRGRRYAAALTMIGPCPAERIRSDVFESLLAAPFEFLLNQSITATVIDRSKSLHGMERLKHVDHRTPAGHIEMPEASASSMFEHELVLIVYGDSVAQLEVNVRRATALLDAKGMYLSCEQGSALVCAYFSVLPGNFRMGRIRAMPLNASGLVKLFPLTQHGGFEPHARTQASVDEAIS